MGESFRRSGKDGLLLSQALGNTAIVLAAVVPWSIAGSVPLEPWGLRPGHPLLLLPVRRSGVRLALPPEAVPNGIKFDPF